VALALLLLYVTFAPLLGRAAPRPVRAEEEVPAPPRLPAPAAPPAVAAMPRYRRVAVALELGPADQAVLDHVSRLVTGTDTEVVLLHVAESAASRYLGEESSDQESREDRQALESLAEQFRARGVRASLMLGFGEVQVELARLVEESGADVLVTGAHGHRLLQDLLYGATVSGLRHRVRIPVLTVPSAAPPGEAAKTNPPGPAAPS
jgi:manganese transport protein